MPITAGAASGRTFRVSESLPPNFRETIERNLQRHAFKPIDPERGELQSIGWVNIRQLLDTRLTLEKVLFRNLIALGLRIDRLTINQRLFRATLAQEIGKKLREKGVSNLSREERLVLEDKVRIDLIKRTQPATALYEMVWQLDTGVVFFGTGGQKIGLVFADLFAETFQVNVDPQYPYLRAQCWADRQKLGQELLELLPSPFSPDAPLEVIEAINAEEDEE